MNLSFERKRLLFNGYYYPLSFVVFEHPTILGQYIPNNYQIQINKYLIYKSSEEELTNIIRHEICHYLCHIKHGQEIKSHGIEFRQTCEQFGYGKEVYSSTIELGKDLLNSKNNKVFEKIKKLFKLASSENPHEAQLATVKANDL